MNAPNLGKKLVVGIALVCVSAGYVRADKIALQEKLSKEIKIELRDVTIAEALEKIGKKADVKIVLSDEAEWKLPQGKATRLSVMMQGPLADSLTEMLNAFFMRYAVGDEDITIYPRPELQHIIGRPTPRELELLNAIYTRKIATIDDQAFYLFLKDLLGQQMLIVPFDYQRHVAEALYELAKQGGKQEDGVFVLPAPATLAQVMNALTEYWHVSWKEFPVQSPEIRFVRSRDLMDVRLSQVIDLSYQQEPVERILYHLGAMAGMNVSIEPGLNLHEQKLSVAIYNITAREAFERIIAMIGQRCIFQSPDNIRILAAEQERKKSEQKSGRDDYVGKISIPMEGGKYYIEFMLREKDLTDELKKLWQEKMKEILKVPGLYELAPAAETNPRDELQKMETVY